MVFLIVFSLNKRFFFKKWSGAILGIKAVMMSPFLRDSVGILGACCLFRVLVLLLGHLYLPSAES